MEIKMQPELLNLPWASLLTLACGYAAYYVANVGIREHHKTIDVTFSTLLFGFFSVFLYTALRRYDLLNILWASAAAFLFAVVLGGFWSRFGRSILKWALRKSHVSMSDDIPSAWMAIFEARTKAKRLPIATQLAVKLKDGSWLKCDNLDRFKDCPNGPCVFGGKGDLLMYVTHTQASEADEFTAYEDVEIPWWGAEITYIPATEIARLDFRRATS